MQPIIAKQILPWFGGSAAVWAVCMVFFQTMLLAGYAYADVLARRVAPRAQWALHSALLAASLAFLPILARASFKPRGDADPMLWILALLVATIGLPYFLLSSTGPLVQSWAGRSGAGLRVYRLFSLSNLASLAALLAYPFAIEPRWPLRAQAIAWSIGYALFALLCTATAWRASRVPAEHPAATARRPIGPEGQVAGRADDGAAAWRLWLALPACATALLVAVTNHLTQNVASVPFLWVLPLVLYLLSFVITFEHDRWYRRAWMLPPAGALTLAGAWGLTESFGADLRSAVPLYLALLFALCLALHGEVARRKPAPRLLTRYYLMLAAGGALGGIAVGLLAPILLADYYEFGLALAASWLLLARALRRPRAGVAAALAVAAVCAVFLGLQVRSDRDGARVLQRNFYGTLQTRERTDPTDGERLRVLWHGAVKHGEQYLSERRRAEPTTYYGPQSGVGLAIAQAPASPRHIGLIGLGAGTLALYGRGGDRLRFYEINPQVIELAQREFSFLRDSAATIEMVLGDARLALEREPAQGFDVLAVDAFTGDAVPVHLITTQAMQRYWVHMRPGGIVAFHVTNRFLDLAPVIMRIAQAQGLHAVLVHDEAEASPALRRTDWVLVARDPRALAGAAIRRAGVAPTPRPGLRAWTDDDNNLFSVLR